MCQSAYRLVLIFCISVFFRACRGKLATLVVRFPNQGRQVDDIEIWSHTNETIGKYCLNFSSLSVYFDIKKLFPLNCVTML